MNLIANFKWMITQQMWILDNSFYGCYPPIAWKHWTSAFFHRKLLESQDSFWNLHLSLQLVSEHNELVIRQASITIYIQISMKCSVSWWESWKRAMFAGSLESFRAWSSSFSTKSLLSVWSWKSGVSLLSWCSLWSRKSVNSSRSSFSRNTSWTRWPSRSRGACDLKMKYINKQKLPTSNIKICQHRIMFTIITLPSSPFGPLGPGLPGLPVGPCGPGIPCSPFFPSWPWSPGLPRGPVGPFIPGNPGGPEGPGGQMTHGSGACPRGGSNAPSLPGGPSTPGFPSIPSWPSSPGGPAGPTGPCWQVQPRKTLNIWLLKSSTYKLAVGIPQQLQPYNLRSLALQSVLVDRFRIRQRHQNRIRWLKEVLVVEETLFVTPRTSLISIEELTKTPFSFRTICRSYRPLSPTQDAINGNNFNPQVSGLGLNF